ncbi:MAG TPA: hypothetical protein PLQ00_00390 [Thermoguttaceae bacterium]|nr:hypothetical protein [Thermoguttaceae bacterium]
MPTLGLLNEALQLLQECGYTIRQEWLDGTLGGTCILKGQKIFFLDLALSPEEQLELVVDALQQEPRISQFYISPSLTNLLRSSKVA